jgi:Xaa-Pro aminopeptidase
MAVAEAEIKKPIPFDTKRLDKLMDDAGIDVLVATSKHNVQYLLGGYRFFFFDTMEAAGTTRYLPAIVYQKGKPETAAYVGCTMENFERELGKFWQPTHIAKLGPVRRIGVESAFLPADGEAVLRRGVSNVELVDAVFPLERLRAKKTPEEIGYLREASERVVDSMLTTFKQHCRPGATKLEVVEALRREEVNRGLIFDYCLMTVGTSLNRAPSEQTLKPGDIISLDSGGNYKGYIGDLCRMGVVGGKVDAEYEDLLAWVDEVQQAVRKPIRAGARGGDIADIADRMLEASPHKKYSHFMAHGMGPPAHVVRGL